MKGEHDVTIGQQDDRKMELCEMRKDYKEGKRTRRT